MPIIFSRALFSSDWLENVKRLIWLSSKIWLWICSKNTSVLRSNTMSHRSCRSRFAILRVGSLRENRTKLRSRKSHRTTRNTSRTRLTTNGIIFETCVVHLLFRRFSYTYRWTLVLSLFSAPCTIPPISQHRPVLMAHLPNQVSVRNQEESCHSVLCFCHPTSAKKFIPI
ncbi:hypothetical protein ANCCAN_27714 [Ancylostoma caninum]|uniref:Uncharacterized protein n=1 Tax=Ancylostoma caninum TaxID=29170 RepID=A0A368F6A3_ANCCA|nr:hypothetical protein ANCCAN_27714 [Ancylostoma caninum]